MATILMLVCVGVLATGQEAKSVTDAEKKEFIELVMKLPTKGEFFSDEAIKKAGPNLRILLALSEKDIGKGDIYRFLALGRGLCGQKEHRDYAVKHFAAIAHPEFKLGWATMLFNEKAVSTDIVRYLRTALESKEQSKILSAMLGPEFENFKKRVNEFINAV